MKGGGDLRFSGSLFSVGGLLGLFDLSLEHLLFGLGFGDGLLGGGGGILDGFNLRRDEGFVRHGGGGLLFFQRLL